MNYWARASSLGSRCFTGTIRSRSIIAAAWLNRDTVEWFGQFADVVARKLSDRVRNWMTLNEPQVFIGAGHHEGRHAPGDRLRFAEVLLAGHHALLAHGRSVQAIRAASMKPARVGFAPVGLAKIPETESAADLERRAKGRVRGRRRNGVDQQLVDGSGVFGALPGRGAALLRGAGAPDCVRRSGADQPTRGLLRDQHLPRPVRAPRRGRSPSPWRRPSVIRSLPSNGW